jgi:hypothetical protein
MCVACVMSVCACVMLVMCMRGGDDGYDTSMTLVLVFGVGCVCDLCCAACVVRGVVCGCVCCVGGWRRRDTTVRVVDDSA